MSRGFDAVSELTIAAPVSEVWDTLTNPDRVREYMHGTNLATDWKPGNPITWSGEWKGEAYQDKGEILEVRPQELLKYTHWSPMGGSEDKPENYHTLTYELTAAGDQTHLKLTQDNNPTPEAAEQMARDNWGPVLAGLKETAEK